MPGRLWGFGCWNARRGDAEDVHRLEAEAELLAGLGGKYVVAAELAHGV